MLGEIAGLISIVSRSNGRPAHPSDTKAGRLAID